MSEQPTPSFFARLLLAWVAYFRVLFDAQFAAGVARLREGAPALPPPEEREPIEERAKKKKEKKEKAAPPVVLKEATPDAALQLLALLQREGRFIDFLEEDVSGFSDADIGAAARVVHDGCKKALDEHFSIEPVHEKDEGSSVKVEKGFDAHAIRLTGNVVGEAPFTGELTHRGWRCAEVRLPKMSEGHDPKILAPAEVELS
ncbi:MAG: DUF2760 domain-containing protein [Sandaracinaceae bacterium]|nr:DUF2760 domain-containing protein [Sandaracinaceae bacterium]